MIEFVEEYRNVVDRAGWGSGPWDGEPDKVVWFDESTGLPCMVRRNPFMGFLCGYVGVPDTHPLHGERYVDHDELGVHSGLTYSDRCHEDGDFAICHHADDGGPVWWFGFDCGHAWDICPGMDARERASGWDPEKYRTPDTLYRPMGYVIAECEYLAAQLAEVAG